MTASTAERLRTRRRLRCRAEAVRALAGRPSIPGLESRHRSCRHSEADLASEAWKGIPTGIDGARAEFFLDPQQLVVLGDAIASRRRAGLDLTRVVGDREIGDRRILAFA